MQKEKSESAIIIIMQNHTCIWQGGKLCLFLFLDFHYSWFIIVCIAKKKKTSNQDQFSWKPSLDKWSKYNIVWAKAPGKLEGTFIHTGDIGPHGKHTTRDICPCYLLCYNFLRVKIFLEYIHSSIPQPVSLHTDLKI